MRRLEVGLLAYWCRALPLLALVDGGEAKHALQEAADPGELRKGLRGLEEMPPGTSARSAPASFGRLTEQHLAADREALLSFKGSINASVWPAANPRPGFMPLFAMAGWDAASPLAVCEWPGITCGTVGGVRRVTGVDFKGEVDGFIANGALEGLPPVRTRGSIIGELAELAKLTELRVLRVRSTSTYGRLEELAPLRHLRELDLDGESYLAGDIGALARLTELTDLVIAGMGPGITGTIASLAPLRRLRQLTLDRRGGGSTGPRPAACLEGLGLVNCCGALRSPSTPPGLAPSTPPPSRPGGAEEIFQPSSESDRGDIDHPIVNIRRIREEGTWVRYPEAGPKAYRWLGPGVAATSDPRQQFTCGAAMDCQVRGSTSQLAELFPDLEALRLPGCAIEGSVAALASLRNLTALRLTNTHVTGEPEALQGLALSNLELSNSWVAGSVRGLRTSTPLGPHWVTLSSAPAPNLPSHMLLQVAHAWARCDTDQVQFVPKSDMRGRERSAELPGVPSAPAQRHGDAHAARQAVPARRRGVHRRRPALGRTRLLLHRVPPPRTCTKLSLCKVHA